MNGYRHLFYMGVIGFFSAMPMYFLVSTLTIFAKEKGLCLEDIGLLSLMTFPYSLKIIISAILSRWCSVPLIKWIGNHRFWAIVSQCSIAFLFYKGPLGSIHRVLVWVFCVSLMSTILDCVLEAYRIESTSMQKQSTASGANAFGWRLGAWVVGYVPLVISYHWGWNNALRFLFALSLMGLVSMLFLRPLNGSSKKEIQRPHIINSLLMGVSFFQSQTHFGYVIAMILSYKMGDIFLRHMIGCYLVDAGCSTNVIAQMDKGLGIIGSLAGVTLCGAWIYKKNLQNGFYLWLGTKTVTALLFFAHSVFFFSDRGAWSLKFLWFVDAFSHFAGGIGNTALLSYLSFLCQNSQKQTMVCYAILSSMSAIGRTLVSTFSGYVAGMSQSWSVFFVFAIVALVPSFFIMGLKKPFIIGKGSRL